MKIRCSNCSKVILLRVMQKSAGQACRFAYTHLSNGSFKKHNLDKKELFYQLGPTDLFC